MTNEEPPGREPPGRKEELFDALAFLTGHLKAATSYDRQAIDALHDKLAQASVRSDLAATRNRYFFGRKLRPVLC